METQNTVGTVTPVMVIPISPSAQLQWCYEFLGKTSRSFAVVIRALGEELRDAVCIFYLTLRALDTVEDDPKFPKEKKVPELIAFHHRLYEKGWHLDDCGEADEKTLISNFNIVIDVFSRLKKDYQEVIADIAKRMGNGMSEFVQREVITIEDYDLYCHYVAGLVGIGLSNLFVASGVEDSWFRTADKLSNSMGLFLQKTNIIRDYLEDINQDRIFWPRAVWSKYAQQLADFKDPQYATEAVYCLNDLITNAMEHVPDCLDYMGHLKDQDTFNFCAIPQIMAIATLTLCYQNHTVFTGVVKMKREDTEKIIAGMDGMKSLYLWFYQFLNVMLSKISFSDPHREQLADIITRSRKIIEDKVGKEQLVSKL